MANLALTLTLSHDDVSVMIDRRGGRGNMLATCETSVGY